MNDTFQVMSSASTKQAHSSNNNNNMAARVGGGRLSGLQKDVISLYRTVLREAVKKDRDALTSPVKPSMLQLLVPKDSSTTSSAFHARAEFRRQAASIKRTDFKTIEYAIRKGYKQVKLLKMPGVKVVGGAATTTTTP
mmetsp:Transcript_14864/g.22633  ORF Transcript_14864/g.22633 Transcript_14864/m.22633 type:complete len:138 (+) Transcript_14864:60-473(+)